MSHMKKKVLFLIHDLGQGGAEKVLVNLVNNMDKLKFDITVMSLFGGGVNEQFLNSDIRYLTVFKKTIPANSKLMKLFTPNHLHWMFIKDSYDIEISYLEGPTARIISGCTSSCTKLISWVHVEQHTRGVASRSFRSEKEAEKCYARFDRHVFVADTVRKDFFNLFPLNKPSHVLYNTVESSVIMQKASEPAPEIQNDGAVKLVTIGTMKEVKGFNRLIHIVKRLKEEGYSIHLYLLGRGPLFDELQQFSKENNLIKQITFLGYQTNPYKYVSKCDLFVCSSYREGFSTAATEALIVGTPVVTTLVSGMKEMLGENDEYGIVVPNDEESLYQGIKRLLDDSVLLSQYKKQAVIRGNMFNTENTVRAVEQMLLNL